MSHPADAPPPDRKRSRVSPETVDAGRTAPVREPTFGGYLQAARLERGIRLEAVAGETRILLSTLEAIESEDLDRLPPEVFLKGFLRAFARAVGADEREVLALYLVRRGVQEAGHPAAAGPFSSTTRSPGGWKLAVLLAALAGLIAVSTLVYHHWTQGRPAETPPPAAQPAVPVPAAAVARPPSETAKRPPMPAAPVHVLEISAQEETWVKVAIDQGTPSEHRLKPGGRIRLEAAAGFNLLVGNAAAIKMTLDNRPVQVPGRRGEAVNLQLP